MIVRSDFPPSMLRGKGGCFIVSVLAELVSQESQIELGRGSCMFLLTNFTHLGAVGNYWLFWRTWRLDSSMLGGHPRKDYSHALRLLSRRQL